MEGLQVLFICQILAEELHKDVGWFLFWFQENPCKHWPWKSKQVGTLLVPKKSAKVNGAGDRDLGDTLESA